VDSRAQVSFEYLLLVAVSVLLVLVAAVLAVQVGSISDNAQLKLLSARDNLLSTATA
jgi:uncharacterized protein (UPF0333 family)